MKKPRLSVLVVITLLFAAFTLGFLLGRNQEETRITVSVPDNMRTAPQEVPAQSEAPDETAPSITFPININTAEKEAFLALPGIGEVLADRILAYRDSHGSFDCVEGLMNVEGIGEKRMEDILEFITIGG